MLISTHKPDFPGAYDLIGVTSLVHDLEGTHACGRVFVCFAVGAPRLCCFARVTHGMAIGAGLALPWPKHRLRMP